MHKQLSQEFQSLNMSYVSVNLSAKINAGAGCLLTLMVASNVQEQKILLIVLWLSLSLLSAIITIIHLDSVVVRFKVKQSVRVLNSFVFGNFLIKHAT